MALQTTRWNAADYLKTEEARSEYLKAAFESGNPQIIAAAIGDVARSKGISHVAKATNRSREVIYKSFKKGGNPTLATLSSVMKEIGFKLSVEPLVIEQTNSLAPNMPAQIRSRKRQAAQKPA